MCPHYFTILGFDTRKVGHRFVIKCVLVVNFILKKIDPLSVVKHVTDFFIY
jgi:hypothetical protein